ncbi:CRISPR-associated endoribonuclease Cas6 [Ruminococcus albus]|uniref:CRISPR-associated endoribonuclease Cas6 n=1 Tax=Ruminococcus albus TaxID=1264 RepID=UPI0012D3139E|nr:CRISPR-associated endoribonuclease Cas6 [Ruminococcus albus]
MMEKIDTVYADHLHVSVVHPYSQYITNEDGCVVWNIHTLDDASSKNIIAVLNSDSFTSAELKSKDMQLSVVSKDYRETSCEELLRKYYLENNSTRYVTIRFITPTAFKSNGKYVIFPTSKLILNSLAKRYDCFSQDSAISDELLFDYIEKQTDIVEYDLKSVKFSLEGITIPSFIGTAKLRFSGSREFICLMNMLMRYGEYSGTGIKTSLGMGAYKIINTGGMIR